MGIEPQLLTCPGHSQVSIFVMLSSQVSTYLSQRRHFPRTDHKKDEGNVKNHDCSFKKSSVHFSVSSFFQFHVYEVLNEAFLKFKHGFH